MEISIRKVENGYLLKAVGVPGVFVCKEYYEMHDMVKTVFTHAEDYAAKHEEEVTEDISTIADAIDKLSRIFDKEAASTEEK